MTDLVPNFLSGDAAFAVSTCGTIVSWNKEAENVFNYSADTVLGRRCWNVLSGQDVYGNRYCCERCPLMQMASNHDSIHSFQIRYQTASRQWKSFSINCLTVFSGDGERLLLHICNSTEDDIQHSDNGVATMVPSANHQRGALTHREREVLTLLSEGKSSREIASLMCISCATVRNHIQHTLYKLRVHNRLEAVVKGQRLNLV